MIVQIERDRWADRARVSRNAMVFWSALVPVNVGLGFWAGSWPLQFIPLTMCAVSAFLYWRTRAAQLVMVALYDETLAKQSAYTQANESLRLWMETYRDRPDAR